MQHLPNKEKKDHSRSEEYRTALQNIYRCTSVQFESHLLNICEFADNVRQTLNLTSVGLVIVFVQK